MKLTWSEQALGRVQEIAGHIALENPGAAERWVVELFDGSYRVFYRIRESVEVLTVRHSSQMVRLDELVERMPTDHQSEALEGGPPQDREGW